MLLAFVPLPLPRRSLQSASAVPTIASLGAAPVSSLSPLRSPSLVLLPSAPSSCSLPRFLVWLAFPAFQSVRSRILLRFSAPPPTLHCLRSLPICRATSSVLTVVCYIPVLHLMPSGYPIVCSSLPLIHSCYTFVSYIPLISSVPTSSTAYSTNLLMRPLVPRPFLPDPPSPSLQP